MKISTFQERLKEALEFNNMRPVDLVNKSGISKQKISQYMSGLYEPKPKALYEICKSLNVNESWLMGWEKPVSKSCFEIITFGNRLKQIRCQNYLTLDELATKYNSTYGGGLNKGTLSKYENGKQEPLFSTVVNLANLLNVTVDYFLQEVIGNEI